MRRNEGRTEFHSDVSSLDAGVWSQSVPYSNPHAVTPRLGGQGPNVGESTGVIFWVLWGILLCTSLTWTVQVVQRVERGELFLLAFTYDHPPTPFEYRDARDTCRDNFLLFVWGVIVVHISATWIGARVRSREDGTAWALLVRWRWLVLLLLVASLLDAMTTVAFFHTQSIADEFHPLVRMSGYTLGRTAGPYGAKACQFLGVVGLGMALPRVAPWLFGMAVTFYGLAAVHNFLHI